MYTQTYFVALSFLANVLPLLDDPVPFPSPTFSTSQPIADFVSFAAVRERLIILDLHTPLCSEPSEVTRMANAVQRAVSRGSDVALHVSRDDLTTNHRTTRLLLDQVYAIWDKVTSGRGDHADDIRVYHRPGMLFGPKARTRGWDVITADHTRGRKHEKARGIVIRRSTWSGIMDRLPEGTPIPETDIAFPHYLRMVRSLRDTGKFPPPRAWRQGDDIAEIDPSLIP